MSNNKRNNFRGNKKDSNKNKTGNQREQRQTKTSSDNSYGADINLWNRSPLYALSTSVQYNKIPGYQYDHSSYVYTAPESEQPLEWIKDPIHADGAVAVFHYVPTLGVSRDAGSPVNQCFNSLFAKLVQSTNSANVGFQQADIALMTLGTETLMTLFEEAKRALGLTNVYYRENGFFPVSILNAMGFSADVLKKKRPEYVSRLQTLVMNFNALGIPKYIELFKRSKILGRHVYMDENTIMSFPFLFQTEGYYVYDDTQSKLIYKPLETSLDTQRMDNLLNAIEESLEALRNTSDLGNIMGAIRRSFPDTELLTLDIPMYDELTEPRYDDEVNWMVNNAMITGGSIGDLDLYQNPDLNLLMCTPIIVAGDSNDYEQTPETMLINSISGAVGPEFVMESTRLMYHAYQDSREGDFVIESCGTEIITRMSLQIKQTTSYIIHDVRTILNVDQLGPDLLEVLATLSRFKNAPRLFLRSGNGLAGISGDLNAYTSITTKQLDQLHLSALQSIYALDIL